jgi:nucleoside-diphosphate-sugar epimerase
MIAVVGGAGEIGSWLVRYLARCDEPVRVIHRGPPSPDLARFALDVHRVDLRDAAALPRALEGARVVVNCAVDKTGAPSISRSVRSNVEACEQLVRACVTNRVQRLVHLSSIAVLPPRLTPEVLSRPFDYSRQREWYRRAKVATERQMLAARDRLEISVIRPGHVYGPTLGWSRLALSRGRRHRIAVPDPATGSRCHVVFVGDLVRLIHRWATLGVPPPPMVHAVSPEPVTWAAFFSEHAAAAGFPDPVVVSPLEELRRRVIPDRPPLARRVLRRLRASPLLHHLRTSPLLRRARAAAKAYRVAGSAGPWTVWPTALELEQYLSCGEFSAAQSGVGPRFSYETSLVDGCRMTAEWHNARWTALDDTESGCVRELLRVTRS